MNKINFVQELKIICNNRLKKIEHTFEMVNEVNYISAIEEPIKVLSTSETMKKEEQKLREEFKDLLEPMPHVNQLPTDFQAEIRLKDPNLSFKNQSYACPHKYHNMWQTLLNQHLAEGHICPSSSPFVSPAFIIPKADPTALPCWVYDYRQLNANTIVDSHPLPRMDNILNECAKSKIFSTIDMINSFFQTHMKWRKYP